MPTTLTGARDAYTLDAQIIRDVDSKIAYLQPSADPFTSLMLRTNQRREAYAPKTEWYEDEQVPWTDTVNHESGAGNSYAADAAVVAIRMANNYHLAGDILFNPGTGERARITSFNSSTLVATVVRNWGTVGLGLWTHGDTMFNLGPAAEENGTSGSGLTTLATEKFNYIQEIKTPVEISNIQKNSKLYGGDDLETQRAKALINHKIRREMAMLFGARAQTAGAGGKYIRTMGGLLSYITQTTAVGATFTEYEMELFLETIFANGSPERVAFCSARAISVINGWAKDKLQINNEATKKYGLAIMEYVSAHGRLALVKHRLLTGSVYGGYVILCDMNNLKYVTMNNMGTKLHTNIQANDLAGVKDEWRTACSLQVMLPTTHGTITGIVA